MFTALATLRNAKSYISNNYLLNIPKHYIMEILNLSTICVINIKNIGNFKSVHISGNIVFYVSDIYNPYNENYLSQYSLSFFEIFPMHLEAPTIYIYIPY